MTVPLRWAWAEIDLDAVAHNVSYLCREAAPADLYAVVKADGYGHGAVAVGRAALAAGAHGLAVALTQEGVALRDAGITSPILLLSEQPPENAPFIVANGLTPTVYTSAGVAALAAAVGARPSRWHEDFCPYPVHIKLDTGMHRVGARPDALSTLLDLVRTHGQLLQVSSVFTHLAVADEPSRPYTDLQLNTFETALQGVWSGETHAANSAGLLAHPAARRDLVRAGIAVYGIMPGPDLEGMCADLRPVLSLKARVSFVKRLPAGASLSYGLRHTLEREATIVTLPIGYADGVSRRLFASGGTVLVGGRRRRIVGVVTMDQLMVDCGDDPVQVGDEAVLIGKQGSEHITATEWAQRLDTIAYEVVCGISARVPRVYLGLAAP
jgi:alanine racemase